jgi:nitrate reductase gamma subunit
MSFLTGLFALLFYAASIILIVGVGYKMWQYTKTPAPLKVPTMPAPLTRTGVALRIVQEVVLFKSLFRANKWIWLFGFIFHFALLLVLLRHLRYFIEPVWFWVALVQPFGKYAAFAMVFGLLGLLARRIFVERIRYISTVADYLMLFLLLAIGVSGLLMNYVARTDIVQVKAFFVGALTFSWQPIPTDPVLLFHLLAVFALMIIFPFSKLLHAPGIFFSPSRNQVDDARDKRHLAPWAATYDSSPAVKGD